MSAPLRLALLGHPVGHSRSAQLFETWSRRGGPALVYEAVDVTAGEVEAALAKLRSGHWQGANVTIPHKTTIAGRLDRLEPEARRAGAVNVVVRREDGSLLGVNTDGEGFWEGCRAALGGELPEGPALILGAGGAARGVAEVLSRRGRQVAVVSRDPARAKREFAGLAESVGWDAAELETAAARTALVVQATPLGMEPAVDCSPPPDVGLLGAKLVVDLVYRPWETLFLRRVRECGVPTLNGWPMLVHQARLAARKWFGADPAGSFLAAAAEVESRDPARPA